MKRNKLKQSTIDKKNAQHTVTHSPWHVRKSKMRVLIRNW